MTSDKRPFDAALEQATVSFDLGNGAKVEMTMAQGDAPPGGRHCGSCSLCCRLVPVATLGKEAGQKCWYARHQAKGCCSVYHTPTQPAVCQVWSCYWLIDSAFPGNRPDRSHYVVDVMPDWIVARQDGIEQRVPVLQIWVDPTYPDAHRDPRLRAWIAQTAERTGMCGLVRYGHHSPGDTLPADLVLIPPHLTTTKEWYERPAVVGPGVGMFSG
jgi:hypothetical protein